MAAPEDRPGETPAVSPREALGPSQVRLPLRRISSTHLHWLPLLARSSCPPWNLLAWVPPFGKAGPAGVCISCRDTRPEAHLDSDS